MKNKLIFASAFVGLLTFGISSSVAQTIEEGGGVIKCTWSTETCSETEVTMPDGSVVTHKVFGTEKTPSIQ